MTDVTITCVTNSEPVHAHAYVCATSGCLADLLAGASGPHYVIALPTVDAGRLRVLLDFLYSMSLDPEIPLTTYLRLSCELKVPHLLEACQHALTQKIQTFGFRIDCADASTVADELRTLYVFILHNFSEGKLREQVISLFAAHPFAFTSVECLRLIPPNVFTKLLEEGCLLMCDADGVVSLGRRYGEQCSRLIEVYSQAHELEASSLQTALQSLLYSAPRRTLISICPLLCQLHAKLYEFYKADQMTDLTITCVTNSEPVHAHAFVCATSGCLADLLAGASGPPYVIALPTVDAGRLRVLLDFLYSMSLDPEIPLTTYLRLSCELKVPHLLEACQHALTQKIQTFGFRIDCANASTVADELRTLYLFILRNFSEGKLREQVISLFAVHPFAFTSVECLRLIPPNVFTKLLEEGCLLMCDADGVVSLGRRYGEQCSRLIEVYSQAHELEASSLQTALQSLLYSAPRRTLISICPLLSPSDSIFISRMEFGYHNRSHCAVLSDKIITHQNFPPHTWKIGGLRAYVARNWEGRRPLAGFDVIYENIWTGETRECLWDNDDERTLYTLEEFRVPPGDVIENVHILHGWLIDQITFVTRTGVHLGPCGLSGGGNVAELSMKDYHSFSLYTAPSPHLSTNQRSHPFPESESVYDRVENDNGNLSSPDLSSHSQDRTPPLIALHGFEYVNIANQGMVFWNNVRFCYSAIDPDSIRSKMLISSALDVLSSLHYAL
ncbi:hypothetical protein AAHC03_027051 [Spirometra sp. Aus1]